MVAKNCLLCSKHYTNIVQHIQNHGFTPNEAFLASQYEINETYDALEERVLKHHTLTSGRLKKIENVQEVFNEMVRKVMCIIEGDSEKCKSNKLKVIVSKQTEEKQNLNCSLNSLGKQTKRLKVTKQNEEQTEEKQNLNCSLDSKLKQNKKVEFLKECEEKSHSNLRPLFTDEVWATIVKGLILNKNSKKENNNTSDKFKNVLMEKIVEEAQKEKIKLKHLLIEYEENEIEKIKRKISQSEFELERESIQKRQKLEEELTRKSEEFLNRLKRDKKEHMLRFDKEIRQKKAKIIAKLDQAYMNTVEIKLERISVDFGTEDD